MRRLLPITFSLAAMLWALPAQAQTFADRFAFEKAAGDVVLNTFEAEALSGSTDSGGLPVIGFGDFTVEATQDAVKVSDADYYGAFNTTPGGARFLYIDTDQGNTGSIMTLTFAAPVVAVGFDYTTLGRNGSDPYIEVDGRALSITPIRVEDAITARFWGFVSEVPFTTITIVSDNESAYGIDDFVYVPLAESERGS